MRRSICYCEPSAALAGQVNTWKFCYTTAAALPKGTRLKFDLLSKGRELDWEIPQCSMKEKENLIWAELPDGKPVTAKLVEGSLSPWYEFTLPAEVKAGETLTILIGSKKGNRAQTTVQRRRPFYLYIDPRGKGDFKEPEVFTIDVKGGPLCNIRVISPSIVSKNKRFDVLIRFEDSYGNLTNNAPEGTLVELSYEHLRENLNWKLFVPETGFTNVPNLYFNEPGIYKIQLHNLKNGAKFFSPPIKCFADADKSLYWGLLHGESERVDSGADIEACLRHFRDERNAQFFATSSFESVEETSNETWKAICHHVAEFNEEHRFTTFLGFQWFSKDPQEGLRQMIYVKDNKPILRFKDSKTNTLRKIYKSHNPREIISIPSFTMAKGFQTTFEDFQPEYERVVEIYSAWGSSECTQKEGNTRPIYSKDKSGVNETEKGSIRKALNQNHRFGFIAGGLDDRGIYEGFYESSQQQYTPGLTAIFALEQTREALFLALYNRACYATTGERILLGYTIAGLQMGSELNTKVKPGLNFNRHIAGYAAGTAPIKEVAIFRNGHLFRSLNPDQAYFEFVVDDTDLLSKIALSSTNERPPFIYYYIRVTQADGHMAWGSPIWIDLTDAAPPIATAPKKARKTNTKYQKSP